ncbi:netrin receptor UNC5B-b-like [Mytilus trossulus]|uniref:netrin receptor UNC5B-b-like n=1 Tax=Mytilus trossulus TaxID=6551 RepID=UPI003006DC1C
MTNSILLIATLIIAVTGLTLSVGVVVFLIYRYVCTKSKKYKSESTDGELSQIETNNRTDERITQNDHDIPLRRKDNDSAIDMQDISSRCSNQYDENDHVAQHFRCGVRSIGPQFTISINRKKANTSTSSDETANVYGHGQPDSQVVAIAQSYYKEKTNSTDIVGIDDMDIINHKQKRKYMLERQNAIDRPTSLLFINPQTSCDDNNLPQEGAFVHRLVTKGGGELTVLGVRLEIPNGALEEDTQVTLGITWDSSLYPQLTKSCTMLSPVVVCQPSIRFLKPVKLSFPHSAVSHDKDWKLLVYYRENDIHETNTEWKKLDSDETCSTEITPNQVVLYLNHFTLYTLIGESLEGRTAVKAVKLLAFTTPFQISRMFTVRIYCINNYEDDSAEMKNIIKSSKELNEKQADVPQPLFIQDNGEDISVSLSKLSNGWENDGNMCQMIDFKSVWNSLSPSCKFLIHPSGHSERKIVCEFTYSQKPSEKERTLKVSDEYREISPLALKKHPGTQRKVMKDLILKLDIKGERDYRLLAEKIGYSYEQIRWLEQQSCPKSPTEIILEKWIGDGRGLQELKPHLHQMGRLDAVSAIEDKNT